MVTVDEPKPPGPQIIDVPASQVQPGDVVNEGHFVSAVTVEYRWNFGTALEPDWAAAAHLMAGTLTLVDEPTGVADPPEVLRPAWGPDVFTTYRADAVVRVVRGMSPPTPPCRFDADGDGNCVFHSDCATRRFRQP